MPMITKEWQGKKVTVMGLGLHGGALGTIEWLVNQGAEVTVTDKKTEKELQASVKKVSHIPGLRLVLGKHEDEDFTRPDMVIRNPGVPRTSEYLQKAREAGVPIEMDSSLFFSHVPSADVIGVTGSKGKTTTANAIAVLLKYLDSSTVAVGIDGVSPLGELPVIQKYSPVVFELSSWRLEALKDKTMSPHIAVVTSLLRDHLNTYDSFEHYMETKHIIVDFQIFPDIAILNFDDERLKTWQPKARTFWYSIGDSIPGDGIYVKEGIITVRNTTQETPLFSVHDLPLHHTHEQRNLLPALLIGFLRGMAPDELKKAISLVHALPHRLEHVAEIDGVTYINDSAATMPDATMAALKSIGDTPLVHILGGSDKELQFEELAKAYSSVTLRGLVFLPGTATDRIKEAVTGAVSATVPIVMAHSMQEAVKEAQKLAQVGDTVLLSPGATSFGLFQHEFDRGNQYRDAVLKLR